VLLGVAVAVLLAVVAVGGFLLTRQDQQVASTTSVAESDGGSGSRDAIASPSEDTEESGEEEPEETESASPRPTASPGSDASPRPSVGSELVATVTGSLPGVTLEVFPLVRNGDQVTLELDVTFPEDADSFYATCDFTFESSCGGSSSGVEDPNDISDFVGVTLVDVDNAQRHLMLRQGNNGECLCSRTMAPFEPGTPSRLFATFPAPPDDVTTMTVEVVKFAPVPQVPIS